MRLITKLYKSKPKQRNKINTLITFDWILVLYIICFFLLRHESFMNQYQMLENKGNMDFQ